jgi:signal transduction histidine kinase
VGTTAGIIIGDHYQQQAKEQEKDAQEEIRLLNQLQTRLLQTRTHEHELIYSLEQPERLQNEVSHFIKHAAELKRLWSEFKSSEGNTKNSKVEELPQEIEMARGILQNHQGLVEAYLHQIEEFLKQIDGSNLKPEELEATQKLILNFNKGSLPLEINHLSDNLTELLKLTYEEFEQAEANTIAAQGLRVRLIVVSMLLSVAIATFLALYTSRAIARPLRAVTDVAQQVTEDGNFNLQAPVATEDEVGVLAVSLNSLIQRVAAYTQELELARQTLERRVDERTQELSQKNQQLLQAHNQLSQTLQNLQQTQAQLIQTEKMSSLGQMIAGVAHEINNPLNFIYNNLEYANNYTQDLLKLVRLYQQQYSNPTAVIQDQTEAIDLDFLVEDLPKTLSSMEMGAERMRQLVLSLRNFSRVDEAEVKLVNLHEGIESTLLILNHQLKQRIEVVKQYGDLPLVECYPAQLNQVFMNILQNAIDALQDAGERPHKQIVIKTETVAANQIQVRIQDNGPGMPSEIKNKIFDPFFTTKAVGKGTGLGLSICFQIINKHQGQMEVIAQPNQGTEFAIALPIQQPHSSVVATSDKLPTAEIPPAFKCPSSV